MPEPLRAGLGIAAGRITFAEVTRQDASRWLEICDTTAAARLPLLMLAPIAVTFEYAMTQVEGRNTWRTDNRWSPCPRTEAGQYLAFLAGVGYQLTPIEQAVADGVPWTGDTPDSEPLTRGADPGDASDGPDPATSPDSADTGQHTPDTGPSEDHQPAGTEPVGAPDSATPAAA